MISRATILLIAFSSVVLAQPAKTGKRPVDPPTLVQAIQGIWWSPDVPESAAFQISDSVFYYPDSFIELRYHLSGDTLFVHREDGITPAVIVRVTKDTLILRSFDAEQIYTREEPQHR